MDLFKFTNNIQHLKYTVEYIKTPSVETPSIETPIIQAFYFLEIKKLML